MTVETKTTRKGRVVIHDTGKMGLLGLIIVCNTVLRATGSISVSEWRLFAFGITSFLLGNGLNAVRGKLGSPVLAARDAVPALLKLPAGDEVAVVPASAPAGGLDAATWHAQVVAELVSLAGLTEGQADTLAGELAAGTTPAELQSLGWGVNVVEAAKLVLARHGEPA